jgi:hypothetical protein
VQRPPTFLLSPKQHPGRHVLVALTEMLALFDAEMVLVPVLSVDVLLVSIVLSSGGKGSGLTDSL